MHSSFVAKNAAQRFPDAPTSLCSSSSTPLLFTRSLRTATLQRLRGSHQQQQPAAMWRRGVLAIRNSGGGSLFLSSGGGGGGGALFGRSTVQHIDDVRVLQSTGSALRALSNNSSSNSNNNQSSSSSPPPSSANKEDKKYFPPSQAVQNEDLKYLKGLAAANSLGKLLEDATMRTQLGISYPPLRRYLEKDAKNKGMLGLKGVMEMLYTFPPSSTASSSSSKPKVSTTTTNSGSGSQPPPQPPSPAPLSTNTTTATTATRNQNQQFSVGGPPPSPSLSPSPLPSSQSKGGFVKQAGGPAAATTGSQPPPQQQQQQQQQQQNRPQPPYYNNNEAAPSSSSSSSPPYPLPVQQPPPPQQQLEEASTPSRPSIRDALNQQKIFLVSYAPGEHRVVCPKCKGGSKGELSFSATISDDSKSAIFNCFRATCGFSGNVHVDKPSSINKSGFFVSSAMRKRKEEPPVRPTVKFEPLTPEMIEFFAARNISEATLKRNGVSSEVVYDPQLRKENRVIAFPYYRDGVLINVKYRTIDKRFWQSRGAEKILYGLDDVAGQAEVIIVEGEMDKLALEEAGIKNVVSVPDGAPARVKDGDLPPASEDTKYSYLWNCRAWLDQAVRVVIGTDNDAPGDALAEELARRLGRERCWRVRWPLTRPDHEYAARAAQVTLPSDTEEDEGQEEKEYSVGGGKQADDDFSSSSPAAASTASIHEEGGEVLVSQGSEPLVVSEEDDTQSNTTTAAVPSAVDNRWYRKDANEVLQRDGVSLLRAFVEAAEPLPIRGLFRFHEYYDDIIKHYYLELKEGQGVSTGWGTLDKFYKVVPGELTIVTGVPNSGKSEWIDALLANLSEMHGWTFAMCSMEKRATDHARQLAEKYIGSPFFDLPYARRVPRMTHEQLDSAIDWVDDRFHLIRYEDEQLPSVDWVLEIAKAAVYRYGIRGLVIDPYNELDHQRPASMSETEYVSQMLTKVKRFAQTAGVHVWFVAHPRQLREWRGQAPNLYDISGSAHFINKADNGIVVHRNRDPNSSSAAQVQILVRKVRNKAAGTIGDCILEYERVNGRYLDMEDSAMFAPRTSQRMRWNEQQQQQQQWEGGVEKTPGMFVHSDGTVNREPEDFSGF